MKTLALAGVFTCWFLTSMLHQSSKAQYDGILARCIQKVMHSLPIGAGGRLLSKAFSREHFTRKRVGRARQTLLRARNRCRTAFRQERDRTSEDTAGLY
jgi:hypothetical protein